MRSLTKHIKRIFDLKGSKVDRFTKNIEKVDKFKTLKDLDYEWMTKVDPDVFNNLFTSSSILQNMLALNLIAYFKVTLECCAQLISWIIHLCSL